MLPIAYYLLKVIICSGILYGYYWLLLRNKVFHKYNRFYLMVSVVLSLLLPLIKIDFWQQNAGQQSSVIKVLQAVSNGDEYMDAVVVTAKNNSLSSEQLYPLLYLLVSLILLVVFMHTLFVIAGLLKKYPKQIIERVSFVNTDAKSTPFSFLKYIFWNKNIDIESTTGNQIFKHELAHVQEGHTYDKLFINLVLIVFWCNPFYWLYRKELNMIHEFIADKKAVEDSDTAAFAAMILQATYPQHRFQLTNNFFYSPIKRRLLMLTKNKNPKVNYAGRIMVLPLLVLVFAAFTFKIKSGQESETSMYNGKKIIVMIDATCGGNVLGWHSPTGINEKDINLSIAQKIKSSNNNENIQIVLSRNSDVNALSEYKSLAKKNKADLIISISLAQNVHNSNERGWDICIPYDTAKYFQQSTLMGSILFDNFSNDYGIPAYQNNLLKRAWVMTTDQCPSIMLQPGHITNINDFNYFNNSKNQEKIAVNILSAINKFAIANLQHDLSSQLQLVDSPPRTIYVNVKHAGENYLKTNDYKSNALVIIDEKEIGNVGNNYVEKKGLNYSTITVYNNDEAIKIYGDKGKYGVIKLTVKDATVVTASNITVDNKNNSINLSSGKSTINEDFNTSLIYIDGKVSTPAELNAIPPAKINSINILKGEKLDAFTEANGKTSVINVTLKPADLPEVKVVSIKPKPLYVIDKIVQDNEFTLSKIEPADIERIDVLKDQTAIAKYGQKAINGVVEITMKKNVQTSHDNVKLLLQSATDLRLQAPDPRFSVGGLSGVRINADEFKKQAEMVVTDGYSFTGADVYFSGEGFKNVVVVHLSGSSLSPLKEYLDHCTTGSVVTFDNVYVSDSRGNKKEIEGKSYSLIGNEVTDKVFTGVEVEAAYAEGNDAWKKYLQQNLNPSIPIAEGWKAGTYTIVVQFIIHTDGSVSDVTTTNYSGTKTAQHCIELIKKSSKWLPAIQNGRAVNAYRKQPITFVITAEEEKKSITGLYSQPLFQLPWLLNKNQSSKTPC